MIRRLSKVLPYGSHYCLFAKPSEKPTIVLNHNLFDWNIKRIENNARSLISVGIKWQHCYICEDYQ